MSDARLIREVSVDVIMKIYEHLRRLCASKKCLSFEDLITGLQFVAGKWSAACAGILIVEGGRGEMKNHCRMGTVFQARWKFLWPAALDSGEQGSAGRSLWVSEEGKGTIEITSSTRRRTCKRGEAEIPFRTGWRDQSARAGGGGWKFILSKY